MTELDKIKEYVYSSEDFSVRGFSRELKDSFIISKDGELFIVFVVEDSRLDNVIHRYGYALYSVRANETLSKNSTEYKAVINDLPDLANVKGIDAIPDFTKKWQLAMEYEDIICNVKRNKKMCEEDRKKYLNYLSESRDLKTDYFKTIYDYFLKAI